MALVIHGTHGLELDGWERSSVWGVDRSEATFGLVVQLWRNSDDSSNPPRHWVIEIPSVPDLIAQIATLTGCTLLEATEAVMPALRRQGEAQGLTVPAA